MKIGDKRVDRIVKFTGDSKKDILACFDKLDEEEKEEKLIELQRKKREINERAKSRF